MNVLIVYAHPNPKSFNHAVLETVREGLAEAGHSVRVKDLYAEGIKANLDASDFESFFGGKTPEDVLRQQADVSWAEGLVFVYPIWWFSTPGILKGWVDRVFSKGFAYDFGEAGPVGLLRHRKALVLNTTGGAEATYEAQGMKPVLTVPMTAGTLGFCGIRDVSSRTYFAVPSATDEERKAMLAEARALAKAF